MSKRKKPEHKGHVPAPGRAFVPLAELHEALAYPDEGLPEVADTDTPDNWQARGLCRQVDPALWFPEKGGSTREAKQVCAGCPVRTECLDYALTHDERYGIFGGLTVKERRRLGRKRQAEAAIDALIERVRAA